MDQRLLVAAPIDVGQRFLDEFQKSTTIIVAFWMRESEEEEWNLCIVCEGVAGKGYGEVVRIASQMRDPEFDLFRVKLLRLGEPLARAVSEIYQEHAGKVPLHVPGRKLQQFGVDEIIIVKGPTGDYSMATGRETLHHILDMEAEHFRQHGRTPRRMKLPVLMAYDLAKCGREDLGELSGRVFKDGITVFEREGFHGMEVEIVRDAKATLEFE